MTEITMESRPCNVMAMFNCVPILRHGAKLGNFRMAENCVCLLGQSLLFVYYVQCCMHALQMRTFKPINPKRRPQFISSASY